MWYFPIIILTAMTLVGLTQESKESVAPAASLLSAAHNNLSTSALASKIDRLAITSVLAEPPPVDLTVHHCGPQRPGTAITEVKLAAKVGG